MRSLNHYFKKNKFKRYKFVILSLVVATLVTSSLLYIYNYQTEVNAARVRDEMEAIIKKSDEDRKAALAANAATELKAIQKAAAQITAQNAITATNATSSSVDSSSCNSSLSHKNPNVIDVIVNKKHCIQPVTFIPSDLVSIGNGFLLSAKATDGFNALMAAARAANEPLSITSSYRSYSNQVSTYNYWVGVSGVAVADTYSARPGYSEHQTGLAFDVADAAGAYPLDSFKKTSQYQWLLANAASYGFIQRYYEGYTSITGYTAEEWHYRYVGVSVAKDMQSKGVKTLEQYWGVSGGDYF